MLPRPPGTCSHPIFPVKVHSNMDLTGLLPPADSRCSTTLPQPIPKIITSPLYRLTTSRNGPSAMFFLAIVAKNKTTLAASPVFFPLAKHPRLMKHSSQHWQTWQLGKHGESPVVFTLSSLSALTRFLSLRHSSRMATKPSLQYPGRPWYFDSPSSTIFDDHCPPPNHHVWHPHAETSTSSSQPRRYIVGKSLV